MDFKPYDLFIVPVQLITKLKELWQNVNFFIFTCPLGWALCHFKVSKQSLSINR
jgi:hypothetical protein